jgi:hypothetical protein
MVGVNQWQIVRSAMSGLAIRKVSKGMRRSSSVWTGSKTHEQMPLEQLVNEVY